MKEQKRKINVRRVVQAVTIILMVTTVIVQVYTVHTRRMIDRRYMEYIMLLENKHCCPSIGCPAAQSKRFH